MNKQANWGIKGLVKELRDIRVHSLETRDRLDKPPRLPDRKTLANILKGLSAALFPNRLGRPNLHDEVIDYFVGNILDNALRDLHEQIHRELHFITEQKGMAQLSEYDAKTIVRRLAAQLPRIRKLLDTDIQAAYQGDPAARTPDEALVCYPGIHAMIHQRIAHVLYQLGVPLTARMITELAHSTTGIDIHPGAEIGESFFIDHGTGVVIGETTVIGNRVRLYQAVTLGAKRFEKSEDGSLVKGNARHPIVEDDVVIYAGATILGRITIGRGSIIGGNVWLTHSVPPDSSITQALLRSELPSNG
ncbi:MAG: serine acetyltransferase [Methylococcales bacterium]|nr:serine acetyltransferase [Methylococcales bacterium]MDD5754390.1 serine acetyltransferase [Methylococcales bacterium]